MSSNAPQILALAKSGDVAGAIAAGEAALETGVRDAGLAMFVGMLCCRQGDLSRGVAHLRRAVTFAPDQAMPAVELARALLSMGDNEAAAVAAVPLADPKTPIGREMQRICAHATVRLGDADEAAAMFDQLVTADAADFESWRGLGGARLVQGDAVGAIAALENATRLRPAIGGAWTDLARAHSVSLAFDAAEDAARRAVALQPDDAAAQLELARALAGLRVLDAARDALSVARANAPDRSDTLCEIADVAMVSKALYMAEADYGRAIELEPTSERAWLGLAMVLERTNRAAELRDLVSACEAAGLSEDVVALPRARVLRSEGRLDEAMSALARVPAEVDPVGQAQLQGDIADRLGDVDTAFAAFTKANALLAESAIGSHDHAEAYRDTFRRLTQLVTPVWYAGWRAAPMPSARRAPLFIFGFPRSGTTLIDTMLSGHADTVVLEEEPVIDRVAAAAGALEHLGQLSDADIARLRAVYFAEVDRIVPDLGDRLIVDKQPLALGSTPVLHRIFPDARFIFAERHPCDVVLSCFITSAQMDAKVANFFDFTSTARLYDQVMAYWYACRDTLAIDVFTTRYERLIADPEAELRAVAMFAGLEWDPRLIDHQRSASARSYIASPSYAQVAEPIYMRAKGRWLRYRQHMDPVLPILKPWVERLGYDLG
ncbi:sulfotransferase [Sphingomonas sp. SUN019]|uniref:tetratricopeptide repeat-containing sulfotransferase family protein n=1 Tax=Sphingomonas sp. SUN019 TaxID=2937788 RepID=UPI00216432AA|nr:tetratricopeptide repeat-containing sulfotransferase family protein [Sphingomonas sp. SUN019]UVO50449.1 sulfotransferase [Sphingomonas sp. SUN019]